MKKILFSLILLIGFSSEILAQNESCSTAIEIFPDTTVIAPAPISGGGCEMCADSAENAVWYKFTANERGSIDITSCQFFGPNTRLWLYTGDCGNLNLVASDDNSCGGIFGNAASLEGFIVSAGTTYYLEWDDNDLDTEFQFDLSFTAAEDCNASFNIVADSVSHNYARIKWNSLNVNTSYTLEYGEGFNLVPGTGTVVSGSVSENNVVELIGLADGTLYSYFIVENCENGASDTSGTNRFRTNIACPLPNAFFGFNEDSITQTTAKIEWDAQNQGAEFTLEYGVAGFQPGAGTKISGTIGEDGPPVYLSGLQDDTEYDYYYSEVCPEGNSDTVGALGFSTLPYCYDVFGVNITLIDDSTVSVDWNSQNDSASFELEYGQRDFTPGTGNKISGNIENRPIVITNLAYATLFDLYVNEKCPNGHFGNNNGPNSFNTPFGTPDNDTCAGAIEISCSGQYSGNTDEATDADRPSSDCLTAPASNGVWYTISGQDKQVNLTLCDVDFNAVVSVYMGDCFAFECVTGSESSALCESNGAYASFPALAGETYLIHVGGRRNFFGGGNYSGNFTLEVSCDELCENVTNDDCAEAIELTILPANSENFTAGSNLCAKPDLTPPFCAGGFFEDVTVNDVWYRFNSGAFTTELELLFDFGSEPFSYAIYNSCNNDQSLECNNNVNALEGIDLTLTPNTDYAIQVWNESGAGLEGAFGILVREKGTVSVNENYRKQSLVLFPQPAKSILNISVDKNGEPFKVLDISGKLVTNGMIESKEINVSQLESGVYILEIRGERYKFIKE